MRASLRPSIITFSAPATGCELPPSKKDAHHSATPFTTSVFAVVPEKAFLPNERAALPNVISLMSPHAAKASSPMSVTQSGTVRFLRASQP